MFWPIQLPLRYQELKPNRSVLMGTRTCSRARARNDSMASILVITGAPVAVPGALDRTVGGEANVVELNFVHPASRYLGGHRNVVFPDLGRVRIDPELALLGSRLRVGGGILGRTRRCP